MSDIRLAGPLMRSVRDDEFDERCWEMLDLLHSVADDIVRAARLLPPEKREAFLEESFEWFTFASKPADSLALVRFRARALESIKSRVLRALQN